MQRMLRHMRACCAHPGLKIRWMPLLISKGSMQGTGRNSLAEIYRALLGPLYGVATGQAIAGRFTSWAHGKTCVVVSELEVGDSKRDAYAHLKERITDSVILMDQKNVKEHSIRNHVNFMAFSNTRYPITIAAHDRRLWVAQTTGALMPNPETFYAWLARPETPGAVLRHLVECVEPHDHAFLNGAPPMTELKEEIIARSKPQVEAALEELIEGKKRPFDSRLFTIQELQAMLQVELGIGDRRPTTNEALASLLRECGFVRIDKRGDGGNRYWTRAREKMHLEQLTPRKLDALHGQRGR